MKKKILLAVISTLLTLIVSLSAAEIYLRLRQPESPRSDYPFGMSFYSHNGKRISKLQGQLRISLAPFTVYKNAPSQQTTAYKINSHGLRGEEILSTDIRPRIIFLGGSAAFGQDVPSDQATIPALLEQSIKTHRVLNAGVVGFLSGQELTYLVTDLIDMQPDLVIAYDGWNDLFDAIYGVERGADELGFNSNFFSFEDQLDQHYQNQTSVLSSFNQFAKLSADHFLVTRRLWLGFANKSSANPQSVDLRSARNARILDAAVQTYVRNISKMSTFSRAYNAKFVVVFQPELGQKPNRTLEENGKLQRGMFATYYQQEFPALYREFVAKAKERLTQAGVNWIDINEAEAFQQNSETIFLDPVHTNKQGNEIVTEIMRPRLQALLELPQHANAKPSPK